MVDPLASAAYAADAARIGAARGDRALAAAAIFQGGVSRSYTSQGRYIQHDTAEEGLAALGALPPSEQARVRDATGISVGHATGALIGDLGTVGQYADALRLADGFVPDSFTSMHWRAGMLIATTALGQPEAARALYRESVALSEREAAFSDLSMIHRAALTHLIVPYHADRVAWREEIAAAAERSAAAAARVGYLERPPLLAWSSLLFIAGRWDEIEAFAAAILPSTGRATYVIYLTTMIGPFARARGDAARAWEQVRAILTDGPASEPGQAFFWTATRLQPLAAALALDAGDLPLARTWLDAHERWLDWGGAMQGRAEHRLGWAEYERAAGNPVAAREHAEAALAHATEPRQPLALLAAHRLCGELATDNGDSTSAQDHLAAALALADACAAPYERALTLLAQAECAFARGDRDAAQALIAAARAICLPLRAVPALARADALDARLAVMPAVPAALPDPPVPPPVPAGANMLSVREVEVLRLVADGLSNAEVAERLSLSARTVGQHLYSIFNKLGVSSRTAAARRGRELRLV